MFVIEILRMMLQLNSRPVFLSVLGDGEIPFAIASVGPEIVICCR